MLFFDFLYYRIAAFYSGYNEKGAESTSAGIVGGFQSMNVFTLFLLFLAMSKEKPHVNKLMVVALFIVFQIYTYIRYIYKESRSVAVLEEKWLKKTETARAQMNLFLWIYGTISIIGCFGLAIYLGNRG